MPSSDSLHLNMRYPTGDPSAIWIATDADPDFVAVGCSRRSRRQAQDEEGEDGRPYFGERGIYILRGREPVTGAMRLYVGKGKTIESRLDLHDRNLTWWTEAVGIIGSRRRWTDTEAKALEAMLYRRAADARRAVLMNVNVPKLPRSMAESEHARLQKTATDIVTRLIALGFVELGYDVEVGDAEGAPASPIDDDVPAAATHVLRSRGLRAYGHLTKSGAFSVLRGSLASLSETESLSTEVRQIRAQLRREGVLVELDGGVLEFAQDFAPPSAPDGPGDADRLMRLAKQVVLGSQGRRAGNWKPLHP